MKVFFRIVAYCIGVLAVLALGVRIGYWCRGELDHVRSLRSRFKQIEVALIDYHDMHGHFPDPVFVTNGLSHSWRVTLMFDSAVPRVSQGYDFSKPWNDPQNMKVSDEGAGFTSFDAPLGDTVATYLTIAPGEKWPSSGPLKSYLVTKGKDQFLIVDFPDSTVHWMEPRY